MKKSDKKLTLEQLIEKADNVKKANPLDLSSDQDLTIALMNFVSLEEHFFFSGAKTGKVGFYDLINTVREMRKELMMRIVKSNNSKEGEVWCISKHLLAASMRLKEVGDKANAQGKKKDAQDLYAKAYDLYSLFWGINMDLIDMAGAKKIDSEILPYKPGVTCDSSAPKSKKSAEKQSTTKRLGDWVRKAVNCCIE
jgi:hypothetical protein